MHKVGRLEWQTACSNKCIAEWHQKAVHQDLINGVMKTKYKDVFFFTKKNARNIKNFQISWYSDVLPAEVTQ